MSYERCLAGVIVALVAIPAIFVICFDQLRAGDIPDLPKVERDVVAAIRTLNVNVRADNGFT